MGKTLAIFLFLALFVCSSLPAFAHTATDAATTEHDHPEQEAETVELDTEVNTIWTYVMIALAGFAGGSIVTFVLLTLTLHPKK